MDSSMIINTTFWRGQRSKEIIHKRRNTNSWYAYGEKRSIMFIIIEMPIKAAGRCQLSPIKLIFKKHNDIQSCRWDVRSLTLLAETQTVATLLEIGFLICIENCKTSYARLFNTQSVVSKSERGGRRRGLHDYQPNAKRGLWFGSWFKQVVWGRHSWDNRRRSNTARY